MIGRVQHLRREWARTRIEREAARRADRLRQALSADIRQAREDGGISLGRLAREAGLSKSYLHAIEAGTTEPRLETLARVGAALGMDLGMRFYPGTGPLIRDGSQAAMIEALLRHTHEGWRPSPEVWVTHPVRGVIDVVLDPDDVVQPLLSVEAQSDLRRLEQQVRWARAKSEALAEARGRSVSRLLLLRSTRRTRAVVAEHAATMRAAYPAPAADAMAALAGQGPWPGAAVIWCDLEHGRARLRPAPPRGSTVGR